MVQEDIWSYVARVQPQQFVSLFSYLAVPIFMVFAFRAWTNRQRQALSNWRSRLGVTSMLAISAIWCSAWMMAIADNFNHRWMMSMSMYDKWFTYIPLVALSATLLAFTLQGRARTYSVAAGLAMILCLLTAWVV